MSVNQRGKRDGMGPFKDSYQRKSGRIGKRKEMGEECPAESKKSRRGSATFTEEEIKRGYRRL